MIAARAPGATFVVSNNSDTGAGSLRVAMASADATTNADFVVFTSGMNGQTITLTNGQFFIFEDVTVDASALPDGVTISGNNTSRVFAVQAGATVVLNGLTISDGYTAGVGGGIHNLGTLTLINTTVSSNSAVSYGGGIENAGPLTLINSTISGNVSASDGGGIDMNPGSVAMTNTTIVDNRSGTTGGGIWQGGATISIADSIVAGNTATNQGDDIYFSGGVITREGVSLIGDNDTAAVDFPAGNPNGNGDFAGTTASPLDPLLAPLADNGGRGLTHALLPGSPAINAALVTADTPATDQRGAPRPFGAGPDIGAYEYIDSGLVVTNSNDRGPGSLLDAVAFSPAGSTVTFNPAFVDNGSIFLNFGELVIDKNLAIDASALPNGFTVSGNSVGRAFNIASGRTITLTGLRISDGVVSGNGGAILNSGTLTLRQVTVADSTATGSGGGIRNNGSLMLGESTLAGNHADNHGGGIYNTGSLAITNTTVAENSSSAAAGGIRNIGSSFRLISSTIASNTAGISGGGLALTSGGPMIMENSIVGGNTAPSGPDIWKNVGTVTLGGVSLLSDLDSSGLSADTNLLVAAPLLAALGDNGGPTQTMMPLPGNPVANAGIATVNTPAADQRGAARDALPDIGAFEDVSIVTTNADSGGGSLRDAVAFAPAGTAVTFDPLLDGQTVTLTSGQIAIPTNLTIDASALADGVTISGNSASRVFWVPTGATVILNGLTVSDGNSPGVGGGIYNQGNLTLVNTTIASNNAVSYGGGIESFIGVLALTNCTVSGNSSSSDGGGIDLNGGSLTVVNSTIVGNSSGTSGGGVWQGGSFSIENSIVAGNTATGFGDDIDKSGGVIIPTGVNLIGDNDTASTDFPIGNPNVNGDLVGTNGAPLDPLLAPLGDYGGPACTMAPLPGSPAIDGGIATNTTPVADQRGALRDAQPDIGSAESVSYVTSTADSGPGTLRNAISVAAPGTNISFAPAAVFVQLSSGPLVVDHDHIIDASDLANPFLASGWNSFRVFEIRPGRTVVLDGLKIRDGYSADDGGAVLNQGTLTVTNTTIYESNADGNGGGINNVGTLTVVDSTVRDNAAGGQGGGIENAGGSLTVINSTLAGNSAATDGGGVDTRSGSGLTVVNSTITDNSAGGDGGGLWMAAPITLENSIVAANAATNSGDDVYKSAGSITIRGSNLIGNNDTVASDFPVGPLAGMPGTPLDPLLGPVVLGFEIAPPLAGSPAIDGGVTLGSTPPADQRGALRDAQPDLGAIESVAVVKVAANSGAGSLRNALAYSPAGGTITFDPSLDGATIILTNGQLTANQDVNIDASALAGGLTVSGNNASRVLEISSGRAVTLAGLTIADGTSAGAGGGIHNFGLLALRNVTVSGNSALFGGGLNNANGSLTLINSTVSGNIADDGGGIHAFNTGVTAINSTISGNSAGANDGGGISMAGGYLTMENSIVASNTASGSGGDVYKSSGVVTNLGANLIGNNDTVAADFPAGAPNGNGDFVGTLGSPLNPRLAPLADYEGSTFTMPPLPDSLAIDAAVVSTNTPDLDQRGAWRQGAVDIGAVEFISVVTNAPDSAVGSLRSIIDHASPTTTITFDPLFDGQTLVLTNGQIGLNRDVSIDASALSSGIAVSGNNASRVFEVTAGNTVLLNGLTVTNGNSFGGYGGGISNSGALTLTDVVVAGNVGKWAGGIMNEAGGELALVNTTVATNLCFGHGGGIFNRNGAVLTLVNATVTGNSCPVLGGGIMSDGGVLALTNTSVAGNHSVAQGGGIFSFGPLHLENCVVAGNTSDAFGDDIAKIGAAATSAGANLIGDNDTVTNEFPAGPLSGTVASPLDPLLAPLADNGGPTPTMAPLPGSLATDSGIFIPGSTPAFDQRGVDRILGGALDLGAYEESTLAPTMVSLASRWGTNAFVGDTLWLSPDSNFVTRFTVSTLAGTNVQGFADGSGSSALFSIPYGVFADTNNDTVFVADMGNNRIRRLLPDGLVDTMAGSGDYGLVDGTPDVAKFAFPLGVVSDPAGNVYVADSENHRIRKVTPAGAVSTFAGSGDGFVNGPVLSAKFSCPTSIARDGSGNFYVADMLNHCIRKITAGGHVETLAGSGVAGFANGTGGSAQFNFPSGLVLGLDDNLYVADRDNHRIRRVTLAGVVTTFAGTGAADFLDHAVATSAKFNSPSDVAIDQFLNVYVADRGNERIRKIAPTNTTTIAGTGASGYVDGDGASAQFDSPTGLTVDRALNVYVADALNHRIRKISPLPRPFTAHIVGADYIADLDLLNHGTTYFYRWAKTATTNVGPILNFTTPSPDIAVYAGPNVQGPEITNGQPAALDVGITGHNVPVTNDVTIANVGDYALALSSMTAPTGYTVLGFSPGSLAAGATLTVQLRLQSASSGVFAGDVTIGSDDNDEPTFIFGVTGAVVAAPTVVTLPADGMSTNDATLNGSVNPEGSPADAFFEYSTDPDLNAPLETYTVAGAGTNGYADGVGTAAVFNVTQGVAVDSNGVVYVADQLNHRIRKIATNGLVTTLAGSGTGGFLDATGAAAKFSRPTGIAVGPGGNIYVADHLNHRIRKVTPGGVVTTLAGSGVAGFADGAAGAAEFLFPSGLVVDDSGQIFVADSGNHRVRMIATNGVVSTVAGTGADGFANGNAITTAEFSSPWGVAVDAAGTTVYVADRDNHRIRAVAAGNVTTLVGSGIAGHQNGAGIVARFSAPSGVAVDAAGNVLVADRDNHRIRHIATPGGVVSDVAGDGAAGHADVPGPSGRLLPATFAQFSSPVAVAAGVGDRLFVADNGNARIRCVARGALDVVSAATALVGTNALPVAAVVTNRFEPGATYYFRAAATNAGGRGDGAILSFVIDPPEIAVHAGATTADVEIVHAQSSPVDFGVAPQSTTITQDFTIANLGDLPLTISMISVSSNSGYSVVGAPAGVGPTSDVSFVVDFVHTNGGAHTGLVTIVSDAGDEPSFTFPITAFVTAPPDVLTQPATAISSNTATLNADVNPFGASATARFEYSLYSNFTGTATVSTLAGTGLTTPVVNGPGTNATFDSPSGVAADGAGNVYVADELNHLIRKITPAGVVSVLAGSGVPGFADGSGTNAQFNRPAGVATDAAGNVYVGDSVNHRIRKITPGGGVSTYAGFGVAGDTDGAAAAAQFNSPIAVAVANDGTVYVADTGNQRIRKITVGGVVSTLAGSATGGFADGPGASAKFDSPTGIAVDGANTVYVADRFNHRIRSITPAGLVSTLTGTNAAGSVNGTVAVARFNGPRGVAVDALGRIYVADQDNQRIRKIADGVVSTLAGDGVWGFADGVDTVARFKDPLAVEVDAQGYVFVADVSNHRIRKITPPALLAEVPGTIGATNGWASVSVGLTGLQPETVYYFRAAASSVYGLGVGPTLNFIYSTAAGTIVAWRTREFGDAANSGPGANTADPDSGGLENWREYVLGLDPNFTADDALPAWSGSNGVFSITYRRPIGATDVTYEIVGTAALGTPWTPIFVSESIVAVDAWIEEVEVDVPIAVGTNSYFYRLSITPTFELP